MIEGVNLLIIAD